MPRSCFEKFAADASLFLLNSLTVGLAMRPTPLPGARRRSHLDPGSRIACALPPGPDRQVGQGETLPQLRIVERHLHPERPEALKPLQLPELERLDVTSQIT